MGFDGGSADTAGSVATYAVINTNVAAGAAALSFPFVEFLLEGKWTNLSVAAGAIAGLVAITPPCGFVEPWAAIVIGLFAGAISRLAVQLKNKFKLVDDPVDVLCCHGVGGVFGYICTGLFATTTINPAG